MHKLGCAKGDSELRITCTLLERYMVSVLALALLDYVMAIALVLVLPRVLPGTRSLTIMRCAHAPLSSSAFPAPHER